MRIAIGFALCLALLACGGSGSGAGGSGGTGGAGGAGGTGGAGGAAGPCPKGTNAQSTVDTDCLACVLSAAVKCIADGHACHNLEGAYADCAQANGCGTENAELCTPCSSQFQAVSDCLFVTCPDFQSACIDGK